MSALFKNLIVFGISWIFMMGILLLASVSLPQSAYAAVSDDPNYTASLLADGLSGPANGVVSRSATNDLLVTEFSSSEVSKIDATTGSVSLFASVSSPDEMAINSAGDVYVKTHPSGPINRFDSTGSPLGSFAAPGSSPTGVAFDNNDNFYVADSATGTIWKFAAGTFTGPTVFASGFPSLEGMDFSPSGKLFVTDFQNGRIFEVTPGGTALGDHTEWASGLSIPLNVAFDPVSGDLFASNTDKIVRIPAPGNVITFASGFIETFDLDFDTAGCLYVDDFGLGEVWKFCPITKPVVGGEILGIDMTSLLVAGAAANAGWMIPIAGVTAAGLVGFALRKKIRML
jgi:hypothetical protein